MGSRTTTAAQPQPSVMHGSCIITEENRRTPPKGANTVYECSNASSSSSSSLTQQGWRAVAAAVLL